MIHLDEPMALGCETWEWNIAQRRAVLVHDGGRCRFPGCHHRIVDIHRRLPWDNGGPTDVSNGPLVGNSHHRGFTCHGDTNSTVTLYRPDGTPLGHSNHHQHSRTSVHHG